MNKAHWQYWKHPRTNLWDAQCYAGGNVLFFSRQGYANRGECLDAIKLVSGPNYMAEQVEFKDRVRSPRR